MDLELDWRRDKASKLRQATRFEFCPRGAADSSGAIIPLVIGPRMFQLSADNICQLQASGRASELVSWRESGPANKAGRRCTLMSHSTCARSLARPPARSLAVGPPSWWAHNKPPLPISIEAACACHVRARSGSARGARSAPARRACSERASERASDALSLVAAAAAAAAAAECERH